MGLSMRLGWTEHEARTEHGLGMGLSMRLGWD